jgi:ethanolamine utilization protein EutJ
VNPRLAEMLDLADVAVGANPHVSHAGPIKVGVDLGTANTVIFVLDEQGRPLTGVCEFAQIVRDGLVVDFAGATRLLRRLRGQLEERLGRKLVTAATAYPPGVPLTEIRSTRYVLESAGFEVSALVDEPTAANAVLKLGDGVIVDVGGGTTGIAVIERGTVVYTADEPTGGTHFSLVIAGAHGISLEEAEVLKTDRNEQSRLYPLVRPVMEKVAEIVRRHIADRMATRIYMVGGTSAFPGIAEVVTQVTGIETVVPGNPLFVTPLGVALHDTMDLLVPRVEGGRDGV